MPPPKRSTFEIPSNSISVEPTFMPFTRGLPPPSTPGVRSKRFVIWRPLSGRLWIRRASLVSLTCAPRGGDHRRHARDLHSRLQASDFQRRVDHHGLTGL